MPENGGPFRKHIQLDLSDQAFGELEELQAECGLPSKAETIRHGLRLLKWFKIRNSKAIKSSWKKRADIRRKLYILS